MGDGCAPSTNPRNPRDTHFLNRWLSEGFSIVASDYQGLGTPGTHPYLDVRSGAYNVIDGICAAFKAVVSLGRAVVLVGHSQGAGVAISTAGFAAGYAPSLDVRGVVLSGAYSDENVGRVQPPTTDRFDPIGAHMYLTRAARLVIPDLDPTTIFDERAMPMYERSAELSIGELFAAVLADGLSAAANMNVPLFEKTIATIGERYRFPTYSLSQPIFVGNGRADEMVNIDKSVRFVERLREAGSRVDQRLYDGKDHSTALIATLDDAVPFAKAVLA